MENKTQMKGNKGSLSIRIENILEVCKRFILFHVDRGVLIPLQTFWDFKKSLAPLFMENTQLLHELAASAPR